MRPNNKSDEAKSLPYYTVDDVAKHRSYEDCWVILGESGDRKVYDVTGFLDDHPGGPEILMDLAGQDAHDEFEDIGHSMDARNMLKDLCIGKVKGHDKGASIATESPKIEVRSREGVQPRYGISAVFLVGAILILFFGWFFYPVQ